MEKTVVLIGAGKPAVDCAKEIFAYNERSPQVACRLALFAVDGRNNEFGFFPAGFFRQRGVWAERVNDINAPDFLEILSNIAPDFVLSVNNHQLVRSRLLALPREGVINYHNAPLPRYGGLNACTWAIVNGEAEHGVTWHFVDQRVDSGDIVAQRLFPIYSDETAIQLVMRCNAEGVLLFRELLPAMMEGRLVRRPQLSEHRSYYVKTQIPGEGKVDFSLGRDRFYAFLRGLYYHPFPNPVSHPIASVIRRLFYLDMAISVGETTASDGMVICAEGETLLFAAGGSLWKLIEVRDERLAPLKVEEFIQVYAITEGICFGG